MSKLRGIFITLLGLSLFISCSQYELEPIQSAPAKPEPLAGQDKADNAAAPAGKKNIAYGAYLAGRVAHLRKNFNAAADYYSVAADRDPDNEALLSSIYVILASKGRVKEAAEYAQISLDKGDKNNFTRIIIATQAMKEGRWQDAVSQMNNLQGSIYEGFITPLTNAWAYAGMNQPDKALQALEPLKKEPSFKALYSFHAGMINDYFGRTDEARRNYEVIVNEESAEMSFRALQVITNFYIRNGQKDKAVALSQKYNDDKLLVDMLRNLAKDNADADPENTAPLITGANVGLSEALFNIAATMRQGENGVDIAHIFICLSIYANPKYDLAKLLLADILEGRGMYADANAAYDDIPESSPAYNSVQLKKAANYVAVQDYKGAELLLKTLADDYPDNPQIMMDLGDVLRINGNNEEAIEYYKKALDNLKGNSDSKWIIYYAMGMCYEQLDEMKRAEKYLSQALALGQGHYYVQNYLGYSWLKRGKHINEAFALIVDAYNQAPNDGHISDSLGWALYKLGRYDDAVFYLEKASELEPANALINDHLGDAYWQSGRKTEASFQWKHTLKMKDDSGELDIKAVRKKIAEGMKAETPLPYNQELIAEKLAALPEEDKAAE